MSATNMKRNFVLHDSNGSHDKIYIVNIANHNVDEFVVVGHWGRRGRNFSRQEKGVYDNMDSAMGMALELTGSKIKKGYVSIESPSYSGPVNLSSVSQYLVPEADGSLPTSDPFNPPIAPPPVAAPKSAPNSFVIFRCLDAKGSGEFDVGSSYVGQNHPTIDGWVIVTDNFGDDQECFNDRFEPIEED